MIRQRNPNVPGEVRFDRYVHLLAGESCGPGPSPPLIISVFISINLAVIRQDCTKLNPAPEFSAVRLYTLPESLAIRLAVPPIR